MQTPHRTAVALARAAAAAALLALIAACGAAPAAPAPTSAPPATSAPAPTDAPAPTSAPAPTDAPAPTSAPTTAGEATPAPAPAATEAPAAAAAPGTGTMIAIGVSDSRLSVLKDNAWLEPTIDGRLAACIGTGSAFVDQSGALWAGCADLLRSTDGGATWATAPGEREMIEHSLIAPDGRVWWIGSKQIAVLDLEEEEVVASYAPADATGEEGFPTEAAAFAKDGTLWLGGLNVSGSDLVSFDGAAWKAHGESDALGIESFESPLAILGAADGRALVATSNNLYEVKDGALAPLVPESLALNFPGTVKQLVELPDGAIAMASFEGIVTWDGENLNTIDREDGLPTAKVNALALDAAGRLWAATDDGVAVQDGEGGWKTASASTSGLADSRIVAIAVTGAPELPPAASTPKTSAVSGRVVLGGAPVADTSVMLCSESPKMFFTTGPCEDMSLALTVKTGTDGAFAFTDVPVGTLSLAVQKSDGQWVSFIGGIPALDPGQDVTLGDVKLD